MAMVRPEPTASQIGRLSCSRPIPLMAETRNAEAGDQYAHQARQGQIFTGKNRRADRDGQGREAARQRIDETEIADAVGQIDERVVGVFDQHRYGDERPTGLARRVHERQQGEARHDVRAGNEAEGDQSIP